MKKASSLLILSALSIGLVVPSVQANDNQQSALTSALTECRGIESALERLDCYDRVTRDLDGVQTDTSTVEPAPAASQSRESATAQSESDNFGREHRGVEHADTKRYVEIAEVWQNPRGLWRFRLADGAEWHQVQSGYFDYQEDGHYYIERGMLNSFRLLRDGSNRHIRVRRID